MGKHYDNTYLTFPVEGIDTSTYLFLSEIFYFLFVVVVGLQADGLKKSIFGKPSPYVKLSIMPSRRHLRSWKQHHGQIAKTSFQTNTINPNWTSEVCIKNFV